MWWRLVAPLVVCLLAACGDDTPRPPAASLSASDAELAGLYEAAVEVPDRLWSPTMGIASEEGEGVFELDLTSIPKVQQVFQEVYASIAESEEQNMPKLRAALRKVSAKLTKATWTDNLAFTDDFIVLPADGSEYLGGEYLEDMEESLPKKTLTLLKKRGYLPG